MLLGLLSCGAGTDDKLNEALLDAQIALGSSDCQHAIDTLEAYGRVSTNAHYVKTLASAYACRAGYSTPTFFTSDLPLTATHAPLGGMSLYSTSGVAVTNPLQNDPSFVDLQTAINILLYAGGLASTTEPSAIERAKHFTSDEAGDINSQLLFMELVQFGKYMRVYGNGSATAGATGLKGTGVGTSKCFTSFSNLSGVQQIAINALPVTLACRSTANSHPQLDAALVLPTVRKTRLCHGLVLLNGVFELLPSVLGAASGGSLAAASGLTAAITGFRNALAAADITLNPLTNITLTTINQTSCEADSSVSVFHIEEYFYGMMESVFL
jgi:hypothetical protein